MRRFARRLSNAGNKSPHPSGSASPPATLFMPDAVRHCAARRVLAITAMRQRRVARHFNESPVRDHQYRVDNTTSSETTRATFGGYDRLTRADCVADGASASIEVAIAAGGLRHDDRRSRHERMGGARARYEHERSRRHTHAAAVGYHYYLLPPMARAASFMSMRRRRSSVTIDLSPAAYRERMSPARGISDTIGGDASLLVETPQSFISLAMRGRRFAASWRRKQLGAICDCHCVLPGAGHTRAYAVRSIVETCRGWLSAGWRPWLPAVARFQRAARYYRLKILFITTALIYAYLLLRFFLVSVASSP